MENSSIRLEATGRIIDHCEERILRFAQHDAYAAYDYEAGYLLSSTSTIRREHLRAINSAMLARSRRSAWEPFMNTEPPELRDIPLDLDLVDCSADELEPALRALDRLTGRIAAEPWLTDMAASKVLHLLRPRFIAISDSYVRGRLGVAENNPSGHGARHMAVQRAIRALGRGENRQTLTRLHAWANAFGAIKPDHGNYKGRSIEVRLSKVRILDILIWTDAAVEMGQPFWAPWHRGLTYP